MTRDEHELVKALERLSTDPVLGLTEHADLREAARLLRAYANGNKLNPVPLRQELACPRCQGAGEVVNNAGWSKCRKCNGSGECAKGAPSENHGTTHWGNLSCQDRTVREVVDALRFDMAHNRWELVRLRLMRLSTEDLARMSFYAPEIPGQPDRDDG